MMMMMVMMMMMMVVVVVVVVVMMLSSYDPLKQVIINTILIKVLVFLKLDIRS